MIRYSSTPRIAIRSLCGLALLGGLVAGTMVAQSADAAAAAAPGARVHHAAMCAHHGMHALGKGNDGPVSTGGMHAWGKGDGSTTATGGMHAWGKGDGGTSTGAISSSAD